jgi:hypothetical protein
VFREAPERNVLDLSADDEGAVLSMLQYMHCREDDISRSLADPERALATFELAVKYGIEDLWRRCVAVLTDVKDDGSYGSLWGCLRALTLGECHIGLPWQTLYDAAWAASNRVMARLLLAADDCREIRDLFMMLSNSTWNNLLCSAEAATQSRVIVQDLLLPWAQSRVSHGGLAGLPAEREAAVLAGSADGVTALFHWSKEAPELQAYPFDVELSTETGMAPYSGTFHANVILPAHQSGMHLVLAVIPEPFCQTGECGMGGQ